MNDLSTIEALASAGDYLAVVATARPDGRVHASLVKAGVIADPETGDPSVGIVVAGDARKLVHLRRSGRATVVFTHGWRWAAVEGPVRLEGPDDPAPAAGDRALAPLIRAVYTAAGGTHNDWATFDHVMAEDRRCAVFVHAHSIIGNE